MEKAKREYTTEVTFVKKMPGEVTSPNSRRLKSIFYMIIVPRISHRTFHT